MGAPGNRQKRLQYGEPPDMNAHGAGQVVRFVKPRKGIPRRAVPATISALHDDLSMLAQLSQLSFA